MCITASSVNFIGSREHPRAAERPVRLQVGWENGWGGQSLRSSPGPSASEQTRQSGGATVGPTGARSNPNALVDSTSSHNTPEFGRNAGVPDGLRAAETAFVYLCLSKRATVDTTVQDAPCKVGREKYV